MNSYENPTLSETCDLYSEIDRLQAINAELVAALEGMLGVFAKPHVQTLCEVVDARAALSKAKGE